MIPADRLRALLDDLGLGSGEPSLAPIGDGHSNLTFLVSRGGDRFILRRPPLGRLAPSANDVVREARVLTALAPTPIPVPEVLAICEDEAAIGSPFFLASYVPGHVLVDELPGGWDADAGARIASRIAETLAALHRVDLAATGLSGFGRPSGYLERQLRRFSALLEENATRPLPQLERLTTWLEANIPASPPATFVHGDFRLGNLIFDHRATVAAVLDWEMATTGDPLADLGYLTAMWAEPGDEPTPMTELSRITQTPTFPTRHELSTHYANATGLPLDPLPWYQTLALWKAAIFLEGSYRRFLNGDSTDPYFAHLGEGVPALARAAMARAESA